MKGFIYFALGLVIGALAAKNDQIIGNLKKDLDHQ